MTLNRAVHVLGTDSLNRLAPCAPHRRDALPNTRPANGDRSASDRGHTGGLDRAGLGRTGLGRPGRTGSRRLIDWAARPPRRRRR